MYRKIERIFGGGVQRNLTARKRLFSLLICAGLALSLFGCGAAGGEDAESKAPTDYETQVETIQTETAQEESEEETDDLEQFGDTLSPFQGEWKQTDSKYSRLVISGKDLNFIHESTVGEKEFCDVSTFYFALDDSGKLTVENKHSQPRYNVSIDDNGFLVVESLTRGDTETYEKISDNTEVPAEKVEPAVGMTEVEVYSSTWGAPKKKNVTSTANGEREQWVYDGGYIYFENGCVTSIQEVQP